VSHGGIDRYASRKVRVPDFSPCCRHLNSNASDRCATPDGYSNYRGSGTDNGVRGSSNTLARLVIGRSLADWLQQLPLDGRGQWSASWLDITISWLLSPGVNSDALVGVAYVAAGQHHSSGDAGMFTDFPR
jgi:hypothetical protein